MGKNQHVVPHDGKWAVKGAGNKKVTSTHSTQGDAIDAARGIAQNQQSEVVIHRPNGRIRDKDSYGGIVSEYGLRGAARLHCFAQQGDLKRVYRAQASDIVYTSGG